MWCACNKLVSIMKFVRKKYVPMHLAVLSILKSVMLALKLMIFAMNSLILSLNSLILALRVTILWQLLWSWWSIPLKLIILVLKSLILTLKSMMFAAFTFHNMTKMTTYSCIVLSHPVFWLFHISLWSIWNVYMANACTFCSLWMFGILLLV